MGEDKSPVTTDLLKQTTEAVANFIRWVAELIRRRNWFMLLVLVGVTLALASSTFKTFLVTMFPILAKGSFWTVAWTTAVLSFLAALAVAIATMPRAKASAEVDVAERRAIKGLRPFGFADAEVFGRLERQKALRDCLAVVTDSTFRFGILVGESGCGKTSFLQAGVWPQLSEIGSSHQGIYVRFAEQKPVETIRRALAEQLELPVDWLANENLQKLLEQAFEAAEKPLVLLLDQFEQFFVHRKTEAERKPFVEALAGWYRSPLARSVKLLVSIRADLLYQLVEFHQVLGYDLGPQDIVRLKKFTPQEAARVLAVIAETEELRFDRRFVEDVAEEELANREDMLISPVDVQILAWMINQQNTRELRAFNREAFQKFGGVEGLLTRFLDSVLRARMTEAQRQAAVKVLLALTDLDRQVRAGTLTLAQVQLKLKGDVSATHAEEALQWLARGDVRLVTPVERDSSGQRELGYELAHERMIPALLRLAGKELSEADRANQLLDRRVNEWLGNDFSGRYLLGVRELWAIHRQRAYLVWGARKRQKEKLLLRSWRRVQRAGAVLLVMMVCVSGFSGWLHLTPQGQIQQVRWGIEPLVGRSPLRNAFDETVVSAAAAFAKEGDWGKGVGLVKKYVNRDWERAEFVRQLAEIAIRAGNGEQAPQMLKKALQLTEQMERPEAKSSALSAIATVYGELKDDNNAKVVLDDAITATADIYEPWHKSEALSAIAVASGELKDDKNAKVVLNNATTAAADIDDPRSKFWALSAIAAAATDLSRDIRWSMGCSYR